MITNYKLHARELMAKIAKERFNGVRIDFEDETTDEFEPDEQTQEEKDAFDRDYAIFTIEPHFDYSFLRGSDCPYITPQELDEERFWEDFIAMLQESFGDEAEIKVYRGCNEIEIMRNTI